jgi:apoptosis-inducing factor 2
MSSQKPANIVILGASFAGLSVAHNFLRKTIKDLGTTKTAPKYRVMLVSPSTHLYWNIGAPRAICSPQLVSERSAFVSFVDEFKAYSEGQFQFIQGVAVGTDFRQRTVTLKKHESEDLETIPYHALVVATGTSAHSPLLSLHGSHEKTASALDDFHTGLAWASSVIIVGGGASGVECAGQLATWVNRAQKRKSNELNPKQSIRNRFSKLKLWKKRDSIAAAPNREPIHITLVSGQERLLPRLDPKIGRKAEKMLKGLGVHVMHNVRLLAAQEFPSRTTCCEFSNDLSMACDLFIAATGLEPNTEFLPKEVLDASRYVAVDQRYLRVNAAGDRVYAVGDCCSYAKNTILDVFQSIPTLMHNMRNDLWEWELKVQHPFGGGEEKIEALQDAVYEQDPTMTQMCPITRWGGVGVMFDYRLPSFLVWMFKGRDYNFDKAKGIVTVGEKPYPNKPDFVQGKKKIL